MKNFKLKRITAALRQLTPVQRKVVAAELAALESQPAATRIVEGRFAAVALCPQCASERVVRHGHANGLQRYRCRECGRTFNALSGTPLSRLHKREKWLGQAEALQDGRTLRKAALDLGIHVGTAHRWRHRFLALPERIQPAALSGIAEADETFFSLVVQREAQRLGSKASETGWKGCETRVFA